jgi:hypothetical protein
MEFRCNNCNKNYSSYQSLWNHNKKFHKDICKGSVNSSVNVSKGCVKGVNKSQELINKYICKDCNKSFSCRQSKYEHKKKYCKKDLIVLENKVVPITTINNSNINNGTINNNTINNNHITINQLGKESVDCLPINDILKILSDGNNMPITCIKKLNFNKDIPENHSFCTTTLEGKHFTRINHKTQKPEKINKVDFINEVLDSSLRFLNNISLMVEFDESFRDKIPLDYQNKIKDIMNNQHKFIDAKNKKAFFNCINDMSYNFKDLILETWKLIQPNATYIIDDDEPPLIDENFNYMSSDDEN